MINKLLPQKELNPKFWDANKKLRSEVREHQLRIALEFKKFLQLPETKLTEKVQVVNVKFTGSLANYNYSEYSDVDLHLMLDLSNVPAEELPLVTEYLQSRKDLWNNNHEIDIYGYNVECYPEPYGQPHFATGTYSVTKDEWMVEPNYEAVEPDKELIEKKVTGFMNILKSLESADMKPEDMIKSIEILQTKIKKMRQAGLSEEGEFSVENLVFKILRRLGALDKLSTLKGTILDKSISLES